MPSTEIAEKDSACCESKTLKIFDKFQALYEDQLNKIDESSVDSLQLKVKLLQEWVSDLTEQNVMLVKTVEELEEEALSRVALLEAHMPQKQDPYDLCSTSKLSSQESSITQLTAELEEVKKQLLDKEYLLKSYLKRVEDLRQNAEASKQMKHCSSMTEETWTSKADQLSKLHDELNRFELQLNRTQKETSELKSKLSEAEESVQKLKCHLVNSEKNARDMRAALTAEVAEKHDTILALKREVQHLEEQLRQADMQTHFKDDIIKELRKEVKVARSKETLAEVLGIKEKSRLHIKDKMDQLTEQIAEKDKLVECLELKLKNYMASIEQDQEARMKSIEQREKAIKTAEATICKVKQKITLFTDDVVTLCLRESVGRQFQLKFKKLLKELIDSTNCPQSSKTVLENMQVCDNSKGEAAETATALPDKQVKSLYMSGRRCTGSEDELWEAQRLGELHKSIDQGHKKLLRSWTQLKNTSQQLSCDGLSVELEQYKTCAAEEQCILNKLQTEVNLLLANIASREIQTGCFNRLIESLRERLLTIQNQIRHGCNSFALVNGSSSSECQYSDKGDSVQAWMKKLQDSLCMAHSLLTDLEQNAKIVKEEREEMLRVQKASEAVIQSLQQQLNCMQQIKQRAFDKLHADEKHQREEWNRLVTSVMHYHEMYKQEQVASDDMKEEMQNLLSRLSAKASNQLYRWETSANSLQDSPRDKKNLQCKSSQSWDSALHVCQENNNLDEAYSALLKAQQEVDTLRRLVNMRSDQVPHRVQVLVVRLKEEILSATQIFGCRDKQLSKLENQIMYLHETLQPVQFELTAETACMSGNLYKLQQAIKHFLKHTDQYVSERDLYEQSQLNIQSRLTALQTELETMMGQNSESTPRLNPVKLEPRSVTVKCEPDKTMTVSNVLCEEHNCTFKEKLRRTEDDLLHVKSQLADKENIMSQLRDDLRELSCNLQARDMLVRTQEQTINLLQNSLKIEQEEGSALRHKITDMEAGKTSMVKEYAQKIEEMEAMILKLQDSVKSTDEASVSTQSQKDSVSSSKSWAPWSNKQAPFRRHIHDV